MGTETTVDYRLPVTKVRLLVTVTETVDKIVVEPGPDSTVRNAIARSIERSLTLVTVADSEPRLHVKVESGLMRDYAFDIGLTDDGRLTSTSVDTTGHLGQVLTASVALAGTALALSTGNVPLAALLAVPKVVGEQPLEEYAAEERAAEVDAEPLSPEQQVWQAYRTAFPQQAARLAKLTEEHDALLGALDDAPAAAPGCP